MNEKIMIATAKVKVIPITNATIKNAYIKK